MTSQPPLQGQTPNEGVCKSRRPLDLPVLHVLFCLIQLSLERRSYHGHPTRAIGHQVEFAQKHLYGNATHYKRAPLLE